MHEKNTATESVRHGTLVGCGKGVRRARPSPQLLAAAWRSQACQEKAKRPGSVRVQAVVLRVHQCVGQAVTSSDRDPTGVPLGCSGHLRGMPCWRDRVRQGRQVRGRRTSWNPGGRASGGGTMCCAEGGGSGGDPDTRGRCALIPSALRDGKHNLAMGRLEARQKGRGAWRHASPAGAESMAAFARDSLAGRVDQRSEPLQPPGPSLHFDSAARCGHGHSRRGDGFTMQARRLGGHRRLGRGGQCGR